MKLSVKTGCALLYAAMTCAAQNAPATNAPAPAAAVSTPAQDNTSQPPQKRPSAEPGSRAAAPEPADTAKHYVIGPLDVLFIKVWNNPNLTSPVEVGPDGIMSMPLIGDVKAEGLTREQLKEILQTKLSEFFNNNPEVDVTVSRVNSKRYYISGGVTRTGEFPLLRETTILDALAMAGGFREFANIKKIYVLRNGKRHFFNYKDVSKGKNMEQNLVLQNGDRIFVPE